MAKSKRMFVVGTKPTCRCSCRMSVVERQTDGWDAARGPSLTHNEHCVWSHLKLSDYRVTPEVNAAVEGSEVSTDGAAFK
jgi:hypothetical protein